MGVVGESNTVKQREREREERERKKNSRDFFSWNWLSRWYQNEWTINLGWTHFHNRKKYVFIEKNFQKQKFQKNSVTWASTSKINILRHKKNHFFILAYFTSPCFFITFTDMLNSFDLNKESSLSCSCVRMWD